MLKATKPEDQIYQRLHDFLVSSGPIDENCWPQTAALFTPIHLNKGEAVKRPDEKQTPIIFVGRGLLRYFFLDDEGQEWNKSFAAEESLSPPIVAKDFGEFPPFGIEALENHTELLIANSQDFQTYQSHQPWLDKICQKLIKDILKQRFLREQSFLQEEAKQRYVKFCSQNPELLNRIPQYHLASYLGISEVSLSRIKKELP